ncbi:MAG: hypothetical protein PHQ26_04420 [Bacteroidales bacterium]|nr:hypothetical protein [Bacteroidales bacterium]MDD4770706.1 hypothetical protein [Bacteroidales bacterium]
MCRPSVELLKKQAVCGRNDSNDGRIAAGKASVRRPCRHTAHARTHIVLKNRHHRPPCVRAMRPSLLLSFAEGDTFASNASNTFERSETHPLSFAEGDTFASIASNTFERSETHPLSFAEGDTFASNASNTFERSETHNFWLNPQKKASIQVSIRKKWIEGL